MLELHGHPISNFNNKVKMALLEKAIPFTEITVSASDASFLDLSPMGKIPVIKDGENVIRESAVILQYLEDAYPDKQPLIPKDVIKAARTREIEAYIDLYLDAAARPLFPEAYFGGKVSDEIKTNARENIEKGIKALAKLAQLRPYIAGETFTIADITAYITLPIVRGASLICLQYDPFADFAELNDYLTMIGERDASKKLMSDVQTAMANLSR